MSASKKGKSLKPAKKISLKRFSHDELISKTKYGYFSEDGKEYICTEPEVGQPWLNFITNRKYGVRFSQVGGGFSMLHPNRRINNYNRDTDLPGKFIYIRDNDAKDFWTINYMPVKHKCQYYRYRAGAGYSIIESKTKGIESSFRIFVPIDDDPVDIWTVTLKNTTKKKRRLSVFPYTSWNLAASTHADNDTQWFSYGKKESAKMLVGVYQDPLDIPVCHTGFLATSLEVDGYECSHRNFVGGSYGQLSDPKAVREGKCSNKKEVDERIIACFKHNITLKPGEEKVFSFVHGIASAPAQRRALAKKHLRNPDAALEKVKAHWDKKLNQISVKTPDPVFDRTVNQWLTYQVYQCALWCRSDSARYGYRDVLQDIRGTLSLEPEYSKDRFLDALHYQWADGHCFRQWSGTGDHDDRPYMDSPYWIIYFLSAYLKETDDFSILKKKVKYFDKETGTVYDHAERAYDWLHKKRSVRGLSLLGGGDVNDALDTSGIKMKGESMWLCEAYYWGLCEFAEIAARIKDKKRENLCRKRAEALKKAFNKYSWDGKWFIRAVDDDGNAIGTHKNKCCKIQLYSQTWAAISGISSQKRIVQALESVDKHLEVECGFMTQWPPFDGPDASIGKFSTLTGFPNVYLHGNTFKIAADLKAGRGDRAFALYKKVLPCRRDNDPPSGKKAEPWAFPNNLGTREDPGRSWVGWVTGSVSWLYFIATEWMPGIMPDYDGLRVDPCLPSHFDKMELRRPYKGAVYNVTIKNPDGVQKGVKKIIVDGERIKGNIIKAHGDGKEHSVEVLMG